MRVSAISAKARIRIARLVKEVAFIRIRPISLL